MSHEAVPFASSGLTDGSCEEFLSWGTRELEALGSVEALINAEQLLQEVLGVHRVELYLDPGRIVPAEDAGKYLRLISLRKKRIPLAYLTGRAFFRNEVLEVTSDCLIPRSETEVLVETFIKISGFRKTEYFSFLDLGTGSGAIGISVMREFQCSRGTFLDCSEKALAVAQRNLMRCGFEKRSEIICSDLFSALKGQEAQKWDAILSNPPYFCGKDWESLQPEIGYEPVRALDGGGDGLDFYRTIVHGAKKNLTEKGWLVFEVGQGQAGEVSKMLAENSYRDVRVEKDYSGVERVVMAQMNQHG